MGWKPSTRGVGLDMVRKRGEAIGIRFLRVGGHGGGQSYLGFRMLAWPLVEEGFLPEFWARIWRQGMGLNWKDTRRVGKILSGVQSAGWDSVAWKISTRDVGLVFRELVCNLMGWKACARGTGHNMVSSFLLNEERLLGLFSIQFPPIY